METFELIDVDHGPRVVCLILDGRTVYREFGPQGGALTRRSDRFADVATARAALGEWLLKLQVGGYRLGAHEPGLIASIARNPDELDGYQVYADWLTERGDPRAELIHVMVMREQQPEDVSLREWEARLRGEHELRFERPSWAELSLVWRWGFVEGIHAMYGPPPDIAVGESKELPRRMPGWSYEWIMQHLHGLWNHPSGRFVRRVVNGGRCFTVRRLPSGAWRFTREPEVPVRYRGPSAG